MVKDTVTKRLRKDAGMTQAEFSKYFDIPKRTIEDWDRGVRTPHDYLIRMMAYQLHAEGLIEKDGDYYVKRKD